MSLVARRSTGGSYAWPNAWLLGPDGNTAPRLGPGPDPYAGMIASIRTRLPGSTTADETENMMGGQPANMATGFRPCLSPR